MKITARLAYSQLKNNRSRTIGAIIAIVLSSALTTAVCSFVASGNVMLTGLLGKGYGDYAKSYKGMLLTPAIILGLLIMVMSITVISNVFRVSARERITQFGVLKCTGATKKQIIDSVMYESVFLSAVGIPVGIILGLLFAYGGIRITNHYIGNLNDLARIMMTNIKISLDFVITWEALATAAFISFATVLYCAWRPANKTAKIPAIDCIKGAGEIKINEKQVRTNPLIERIFGFEGLLADKNIKRNHKNFRATVISLCVGVILFVGIGGLYKQAKAIEDYMVINMDRNVLAEYTSNYTRDTNKMTGREETIYTHPVDSQLGNEITRKLQNFKDTNVYGVGMDLDTYVTAISDNLITDDMQKALEFQNKDSTALKVELIVIDQKNYEKLCKKAGVPIGSSILLNHYWYNHSGEGVNLQPFSSKMKELQLQKADGSITTIQIQGILTQDEIPQELFEMSPWPVRLVVPEAATVRGFSWMCKTSDVGGFMKYANELLKKEFPTKADSSYAEEGFNTRVYKTDDYIRVMNIAISLATVLVYSFVALLMLIGLTNIISTLATNVMVRSREFAVLKSVGMTPEGLNRMLKFESILCSAKALIIGLPIGILITGLINIPIKSIYPVPYKLPWLIILVCILVVFLITYGTTMYASHRLKNQNIIETIRSESGK
jgi:putative ABC transport system permease protein